MAVLVTTTFDGVAPADYDGMIDGLRAQLLAAPGFMAHVAVVHDGGLKVTEIWDSEDAAQAWVRDVITPMMQHAGGTAPSRQSVPIHAMLIDKTS